LIFQPVKALFLTAVVFYFRDLHVFALAFLGTAMLQVPLLYTVKQRCLPTDTKALARVLSTNLLLAALTLAPAWAVTRWLRPVGQGLPLPLFFACVGGTFVTWAVLLWALKHPLYHEAVPLLQARLKRKPAIAS
jgi:hypothetical protein